MPQTPLLAQYQHQSLQYPLVWDHRLFCVAVKRNSLGSDLLFLSKSHPLSDFIHELYRTECVEVTSPPSFCTGTHLVINQTTR